MKLFTIGFTQKNAEEFFSLLKGSGVERIVDIRLNNVSQMAAFTKKDDLKYFLREIAGIDYVHLPIFAPSKELLADYRKDKDWDRFEEQFRALISERKPLDQIDGSLLLEKSCCLLCSEAEAERCHRRLVAEYLSAGIEEISEIIHL